MSCSQLCRSARKFWSSNEFSRICRCTSIAARGALASRAAGRLCAQPERGRGPLEARPVRASRRAQRPSSAPSAAGRRSILRARSPAAPATTASPRLGDDMHQGRMRAPRAVPARGVSGPRARFPICRGIPWPPVRPGPRGWP
eukprot:scaffold5540_cov390-Prasinococcus_capsulatus_cf.AAC.2